MTFEDFRNQWLGKYPDFDGWYGSQCVDLVQYWSQALGGPRFRGDAKDLINQGGSFFEVVRNTPEAVPRKGDIIVWGTQVGPAGHTAVATGEGDTSRFVSLDVNWPLNTAAHLQTHNYNGVLGWLHPKVLNNNQGIAMIDDTLATLVWVSSFDLPTTDGGYKGFWDYWVGKPVADCIKWVMDQDRHRDIVLKARDYPRLQAENTLLKTGPNGKVKAVIDFANQLIEEPSNGTTGTTPTN